MRLVVRQGTGKTSLTREGTLTREGGAQTGGLAFFLVLSWSMNLVACLGTWERESCKRGDDLAPHFPPRKCSQGLMMIRVDAHTGGCPG